LEAEMEVSAGEVLAAMYVKLQVPVQELRMSSLVETTTAAGVPTVYLLFMIGVRHWMVVLVID